MAQDDVILGALFVLGDDWHGVFRQHWIYRTFEHAPGLRTYEAILSVTYRKLTFEKVAHFGEPACRKYMKIVVIGASGTIGRSVVGVLSQGNEVIKVSRSSGDRRADIENKASLEELFARIGLSDAIVCAAGSAAFKSLASLSDDDFAMSLKSKMMGQVNIVRVGSRYVVPGGSITITSGTLAQEPILGGAAISLVNGALEGFARAAALELESSRVRVNVVSPPWVTETLLAYKMDPSIGLPASEVAKAYLESVESSLTGQVIKPRHSSPT
jgi:NAD(P)-dependent dehydrogenase (short-subunit alcohol dehydrogenase family)